MNLDDLPSNTPMERIERITGFLQRIWGSQRMRKWGTIMAGLAAFSLLLMFSAGAFEPDRADHCYDSVMYYWDIDTFSPMEDHGAYEALEPEEWEIFEDTIGADGIPAQEIAREQCEQVYG